MALTQVTKELIKNIDPSQINSGGAVNGNVLTYNGTVWVPSTGGSGNAKAWVNFDGSLGLTAAPTILASFNISSVARYTDPSNPAIAWNGRFVVNFTTPFSNANYVVAGVCRNSSEASTAPSIAVGRHITKTASSCPITIGTYSTPGDDSTSVMVVFFGN